MKHLLILGFSLLFTLGLVFYNFSSVSYTSSLKEDSKTYPFQTYEIDEHISIKAEIESKDLYEKYNPLFEKHNYSGNGYCWEGHIIQILEKENEELLNHLDFDPEAGGFYVYADDEETKNEFLKILCPIFQDLNLLEKYIQEADRSRIDD